MKLIEDGTYIVDVSEADIDEIKRVMLVTGKYCKLLYPDEERKKGKWVEGQCSICGCDIPAYIIDWKWKKDMDANFCPNCGAYMRGEE